ncbi:hypothetical protein [Streptomyces meridianus]|uniref:Secreted protein n=1 Tax=Streptomyces meridianus TaxID=2938945 RepID=A0ABT0X679_9ACTN|nr:hypothetical protein [Streptomyces meridianus]MCM2577279.1 hypothetical protein [Streptomyces meridianus]
MTRRSSLSRTAAVLTAALALAVIPSAGTAQAHEAITGSLSFTGDAGEYVSGGESHLYTPETTEMFDVSGPTGRGAAGVTVTTPEGERWSLHMEAPYGQELTSGTTYTNASRWPDAGPEDPKLEFGETDRWCTTSTGSFTISHVAYGPYGYIREIDATFEQYCNGSTLALRGEIHARMPEPPAELAVGLNLHSAGAVDTGTGEITVGGTVTCNKPARITLTASAYQTQKKATASGSYEDLVVLCEPGGPVPWAVSFTSNIEPTASFEPGTATLRGIGRANDPDYPTTADTGFQSTEITLVKS